MRILRFWLTPLLAASLAACSTDTAFIAKTVEQAFKGTVNAPVNLIPGQTYLRLTLDGREIFLTFGGVESAPNGVKAKIWYSGGLEVLKTFEGHLYATEGLPTDWKYVRYFDSLPFLAAQNGPASFVRVHDEMPGYKMNIRDHLQLQRIAPPKNSQLKNRSPESLVWLKERAD
jgi:hypothetical protein